MSNDDGGWFNQREQWAAVVTFVSLFALGGVVMAVVPLPWRLVLIVAAADVPAALGVACWMRHKRRRAGG
jgi:hypothetical protein